MDLFGQDVEGGLALAGRELFGRFENVSADRAGNQTNLEGRFAPSLFGQAIFVMALIGLIVSRDRAAVFLALWAGLIVLAWMTLTFIPGRFAVPLIVPLALLGGECLPGRKGYDEGRGCPWLSWLVIPIVIGG